MVKCEKNPIAPASLTIEKSKGKNGKYNCNDVMEQLVHDFHDKCYICELKGLSDPQVEHLIPQSQRGNINIELRFDWQNLFLTCPHCNSVKTRQEFNGTIINCCHEDPEQHLRFTYENNNVTVTALDDKVTSRETAILISDVFNLKGYGSRTKASQYRINELKLEMNQFFNTLLEYKKHKSVLKKKMIVSLLRRETAFAAFKRAYIRNNPQYVELQEYVALD